MLPESDPKVPQPTTGRLGFEPSPLIIEINRIVPGQQGD